LEPAGPVLSPAITAKLAESYYNIVDMNQTVVQGKFAMVLIAEASANAADLAGIATGTQGRG
jgi:predicted amino acid-binding ACT domain protein